MGVPTLDKGYLSWTRGYLCWTGGYLSWTRGYLPWTGVPSFNWEYSLPQGIPTLDGGVYLGQRGTHLGLEDTYPRQGVSTLYWKNLPWTWGVPTMDGGTHPGVSPL